MEKVVVSAINEFLFDNSLTSIARDILYSFQYIIFRPPVLANFTDANSSGIYCDDAVVECRPLARVPCDAISRT